MKHLRTLLLILAAMLMVPSVAMAQGKIYKPHPERSKSVSNSGKGKVNKDKVNNSKNGRGNNTKKKKSYPFHNLDLMAVRDGQTCYISQLEWVTMSDAEHSRYDRKGVVVVGSVVDPFVVDLYDSGEDMTWEEAMNIYGDSLPSLEQAEEMARQYEEINAAIIAYGGDKNPARLYWTKDEHKDDSSIAWVFNVNNGYVNVSYKANPNRVRVVAPVPSSAM